MRRTKLGNYLMIHWLKKESFHIPNKKWLIWLVKKVFVIRAIRGRGKRVLPALRLGLHRGKFNTDLPLKYATRLHIYLTK